MNDTGVFIVFCMGVVSLLTTGLWVRESLRRKRIESRLWVFAASQGLTPNDLLRDVPLPMPAKARVQDSGRLEQLESQMDQMANQLDRLVESQDFLSRVMADRAERLPDPRLRTPH